jgi:hypothetical protein
VPDVGAPELSPGGEIESGEVRPDVEDVEAIAVERRGGVGGEESLGPPLGAVDLDLPRAGVDGRERPISLV